VTAPSRFFPRRSDYLGLRGSWKVDVVAGLTVGVVALPLALAFGITSGMGAKPGLVTAIVAGLVAAVFGGSGVQVSGPTGAMAVVLVPVVARYGVSAVYTVGLLAGALVVVAAFLRLGRYAAFVPWPVIEGFTVGIATLIFLQQVPSALGVAKPQGDNTAVVAARAIGRSLAHGNLGSLLIMVIVVAIMVVAPRVHRALPASLLAVGVATAVAQLAHLTVARIGAIPSALPTPSLPHLSSGSASGLFSAALAVAALAALESLLSAKVADGMADSPKHDPDRELFGQGAANIAAAMFGGMPATGAIARTAVNVRAGARTRVAAIVHAVFLLGVVLLAGNLVSKIPLAALAGVLTVTAVRMVEPHNVRAVVRATRSDAIVFGLTAIATVAFDLVFAIELGMAVAAILALRNVALSASITPESIASADETMPREIDIDAAATLRHDGIIAYRLDGALFFGAAQRFLTELTAVTDVRVIVLRLPDLQVLDATGAQALGEIVSELEARGITVLVKGPQPAHRRTLAAVGALDHLAHENHLFDDLDAALAHAREHARRTPHVVRAVPQ
jgi:sulfate permease, SulP family